MEMNSTTIVEYRSHLFGSLQQADLFYDLDDDSEHIHIKISPVLSTGDITYNCVCLSDGEPSYRAQDNRIVPVNSVTVECNE